MPRACIARVACQAHGGDRISRAERSDALELLLDDELDERADLDVQRARRALRRAWRPDLRGRHWGRGWLASHPRHGLDHLAHLRQLHRTPTTFPARLPRRITRTAPEQVCWGSSLHKATTSLKILRRQSVHGADCRRRVAWRAELTLRLGPRHSSVSCPWPWAWPVFQAQNVLKNVTG